MQEAPQPFGYRSRARVQLRGFGPKSKVGFFRFQSHELEDIESCPLFRPALNEALDSVRRARRNENFDPAVQQLDLACSQEDGTWGMAAAAREADEEGFSAIRGSEDSEIDPVIHRRKIGEFTYSVSPSVFFQANDHLVERMVQRVGELAQESAGTAAALDLFSGVGLFTLGLARRFQSVVGVESSILASRLCARNAADAGLPNIKTICARAVEWMQATAPVSRQNFDLVLLDPPRAGAGTEVMKCLSDWAPGTIVYLSCDPHTMVRDLACLNPGDYEIDSIEGFDLFPQTYHFESLVRLKRLRIDSIADCGLRIAD
jgi:23S rRNA (uracil1939-C5)-methyltransferase